MPQSGNSEVNSCPVQLSKQTEQQEVVQEIYFGIFFDGTGANKFQMMLGKKFRLDKMFKKYLYSKYKFFQDSELEEKIIIENGNDILEKGRDFWEDKNVFTASELDQMFFGYTKDKNIIEKRIVENAEGWDKEIKTGKSDSTQHDKSLSAQPNSSKEVEIIKNAAEQITTGKKLSEKDEIKIKKAEGTVGQDQTYTNIAILESCYQYKKDGNKCYIPIYVEGSGADMQITPFNTTIHTAGHPVEGLAKGTGHTGVTAKVSKMVKMIKRKISSFTISDVNKITFDVFGFSRGATESRIFTHVVKSVNEPESEKNGLPINALAGTDDPFMKKENKFVNYELVVRFLGIMDTVSSIGIIRYLNPAIATTIGDAIPTLVKEIDNKMDYDTIAGVSDLIIPPSIKKLTEIKDVPFLHDKNVDDFCLYDTDFAESVFHICALDEFRRNFALVDIESSINSNGLEVFLPGCHTDIGGAAAIGRDLAKLINIRIKYPKISLAGIDFKFNLGGPDVTEGTEILWPSINQFDAESALYYYIYSYGLEQIGLLKRDEIIDYGKKTNGRLEDNFLDSIEGRNSYATSNPDLGHYVIYHYSQPGYSNISLDLMYNRYLKKAKDAPMSEIPLGYHIPDGLKIYYDKFNDTIKNAENGRLFVSPDEATYQWLRQNYLHISANDQWIDIADNRLVNGPSHFEITTDAPLDHKVIGINKNDKSDTKIAFISRIIYQGLMKPHDTERKSDNNKRKRYDWRFLFDYHPSEHEVITISTIVRPKKVEHPEDHNLFSIRGDGVHNYDANPITQGEGYKVANAPKWIEQDRNGKRYKMLVDSSGTILDEQEISN